MFPLRLDSDQQVGARPSRLKKFDGSIGNIELSQLTSCGINDVRNQLRNAGVPVVITCQSLSTPPGVATLQR